MCKHFSGVTIGGCQVQRGAKEAQIYRISHVSYAEAVGQIGGTTVCIDGAPMAAHVLSGPNVRAGVSAGPGMVSRPIQKSCAHEWAVSKDTLIMNKVDLIAFIGKVINVTRVVKSRRLLWRLQKRYWG